MNEPRIAADDAAVGRCWEGNAAVWTKLARMGFDVYRDLINTPAFLQMLPEVRGLKGLDIGCGEGHNTRQVAQRGASMTAIDIAPTFIEHAKAAEAEKPLGITYQVSSAKELPFRDASFDFVMATMSLMDMAKTERVIAEVFRVLRPGGFFQFSILHPCFMTPHRKTVRDENGMEKHVEIAGYFDTPDGEIERWIFSSAPAELRQELEHFRVPRFHRTLSGWMNLLIDAGFVIERLHEPHADEALAAKYPSVRDTRMVGYFLHVRCRKAR